MTLLQMSDDSDGNSSGHDFSRVVDPHTNNFEVDVAGVNDLLTKRGEARNRKDYATADEIIGRLLARHSVIVNDGDKTWRTGTKKELKKRPKNLFPKKDRSVSVDASNNRNKNTFTLCANAGPNTSTLLNDEISGLVAERRQAQRNRDFKKADQIRFDLKNAGVFVEDALKEWRADGLPFASVGTHKRHTTSSASLVQSTYSEPLHEQDELVVENLLAQRTKYKSSGDYDQSDSIRDRLFESYGVRIDDRLGQWSVGGDFGDEFNSHWAANAKPSMGYVKSAFSEDLSSKADETYVQRKIDERMRAKRTRNYDLSDSIRNDLFRDFDITIHDKINEWSVGGDFGEDNPWTHVDQSFNITPMRQETTSQVSSQEDLSSALLTRKDLAGLKVVELKERLRDVGAKVSGKKEELINRLLETQQ
jgi:cysteinyl-tRNA synthetase